MQLPPQPVRLPQVRDAHPTGKVLSIETGFSCNAYCGFCPQLNYRDDTEVSVDLSTEQIRERLRFGAENGYRQIGFSGGESTIRKDMVELVAYAKQLGYELIGITTNGMMLAYLDYALKIIRAGLNSINVSVHGHTAKLHDAMMRTPGSFDLAMRAIDNVQLIKQKTGLRVDMMSMCLAAPQVIDHFPDQVRLMGQKGVKLHMLQPFLMTKGNTHLAHFYISNWDKIAWAIREGSRVAREHGGHIKLFNIPICLFWDIQDDLERQWRKLDVFREHERDRAGETAFTSVATRHTPPGFYRVDACATCDENCHGFRSEYYPQERILDEVTASVDEHVARHGDGELWLAGTELFTGDTLRRVLEAIRARGVKRLALLTAGIGRAYHEQYEEPIVRLLDEVCFVARPTAPATRGFDPARDPHATHGNFDDLRKGMERLRPMVGRSGFTVSATVNHGLVGTRPEAFAELAAMGIRRVRVGLKYELAGYDFVRGPGFRHAAKELSDQGFEVDLAGDPERFVPLSVVDYRARLLRHRFASPEFFWIAWSVPDWSIEKMAGEA